MVVVIKELMAFHWLSCDPFLWLSSWQEKEGNLSSSSWALLSGHEKSPSNLPVLFHCGLCLLIFYCFNRLFNILENQILDVLHSMGSLCEIYCNSTELPLALRD